MIVFLLKLLIIYFLIYYIGNVIANVASITSSNSFKSVFSKSLFGLFFSTTIFSICITSGITINTGIVFLTILILIKLKPKLRLSTSALKIKKEDLLAFSNSVPVVLLFFSWRYFTLLNEGGEFPVVINMDSLKHVIRASFLINTGIESVNVNYLVLPTGVDPYHYFEAWIIGLFGTATNENLWIVEQLIAFPLISTIITVGFWGLIKRWEPKWYHYLLSCSVVFFTGFYFIEIERFGFLKFTGSFSINAYDEWKGFAVSIAYLIVMLFFNLLFSNQKIIYSILVLLYLPFISITLAPAILSVTFVLILICYLFRHKFPYEVIISDLVYPILVALYIFAFYFIFESKQTYIVKPSASNALSQLSSFLELKSRIVIVAEKFIQAIVLYFPFLITLIYLIFKNKNIFKNSEFKTRWYFFFKLLIAVLSISTFFWQLFYSSFGASQFLFYTAMPFVNISILLILVGATKKLHTLVEKSIVFALFLVSISLFVFRSYKIHTEGKQIWFDKYSNEYIAEVRKELSTLKVRNGLKFEDKSTIVKFNDMNHLVGSFLPGYFNDSYMVSYTLAEMYFKNDFPNKEAQMLIPKAPFVVYCNHQKTKGKFKSTGESAISLIQDKKISFVVIDKYSTLNDSIKPFVTKSIVDKKSHEILYILK